MKPYPPNMSVSILEHHALESLITAGTIGLSHEHHIYAGKQDEIKGPYRLRFGNYSYELRHTPGTWPHLTLIPGHGRRLTVNVARPMGDRPRRPKREDEAHTLIERTSDDPLPNTLYVGNISFGLTDTALLKLFIKHGTVQEVSVVLDKMSGRSRGFAFVRMSSESEASSAILELHDQELLDNGELRSDYTSPDAVSDDAQDSYQSSVMRIIETASRELAKLICYEPAKLRELEWRDLERMLALVFDGIGYAVRLTRSAKDGGKDMVIGFIASGQMHSYYVEVKHWVSGQKVGKHNIKEFLSVVVRDQQQGGVIISTSGFGASAMQGITEIERKRLRFGNSSTIVSLCRTYLNVSGGLMRPVNFTDTLLAATQDNIE